MKTLIAVFLILASFATSVSAENRQFLLVNNTPYLVARLFASNISEDRYSYDMLRDQVIPPYTTVRVDADDGTGHCLFDLRIDVVKPEGIQTVERRADVCTLTDWTINP